MKRFFTGMLSLAVLASLSVAVHAQSSSRDDILKDIAAKRAELQKLEDQFLSPSEEDRAAYRELLSQPDTGLIRLLPREVYEGEAYKKKRKTLTIRGGGAYYSFARLTHEYGYGSDLSLDSGDLSVGFAGADYGMMIDLGGCFPRRDKQRIPARAFSPELFAGQRRIAGARGDSSGP